MNLLCFTLILSTTFLLLITPSCSELCNPNDKSTLLQIKQSFGDPFLLASWTNDSDCCMSWFQVQCDQVTHHIVSLTIFGGELSGAIPSTVGNLSSLKELALRRLPNLSGPIPDAITKLAHLQLLRLDSNNLTGPIPLFLSQLKSLRLLDLSFNNFSGFIPPSLVLLPDLYELHLGHNQLTGSIPECFGMFKHDNISLHLSHNQLSGRVPTSLSGASKLDLSHNQLTGDASFLFLDSSVVDLSWNNFEFDMSEVVFGSKLSILDLNHNMIYGGIPSSLADLIHLQRLNVSYNRLCGRIPTGRRLHKFNESSYIHNRCLCGTPLPSCEHSSFGSSIVRSYLN